MEDFPAPCDGILSADYFTEPNACIDFDKETINADRVEANFASHSNKSMSGLVGPVCCDGRIFSEIEFCKCTQKIPFPQDLDLDVFPRHAMIVSTRGPYLDYDCGCEESRISSVLSLVCESFHFDSCEQTRESTKRMAQVVLFTLNISENSKKLTLKN